MEPICVDGIVWVSLDYKFITQNLDYVQKEKKIPVKHLKPELFRMQKKRGIKGANPKLACNFAKSSLLWITSSRNHIHFHGSSFIRLMGLMSMQVQHIRADNVWTNRLCLQYQRGSGLGKRTTAKPTSISVLLCCSQRLPGSTAGPMRQEVAQNIVVS